MAEPFITAAQVSAVLPGGASVSQALVDSIAEGIQAECGWHIAPIIEETITVDSLGGSILRLPTLNLVELIEVKNTDTDEILAVNPKTGWSKSGSLGLGRRAFRPGESWSSSSRYGDKFPAGFQAVTVTMRHGYETVPAELVRFVAQTARQRISSETLIGRSVSFSGGEEAFSQTSVLDKYRLGVSP